MAVLIPRHKPRPGPPAAPRARRASCLRFASVFRSSGLRPTSRLVTHVAEEEIAMTREPTADDSSSWSAASAGHGAGEREELEAATHARCLSKWRGEEKRPRTEWAHKGVFIVQPYMGLPNTFTCPCRPVRPTVAHHSRASSGEISAVQRRARGSPRPTISTQP